MPRDTVAVLTYHRVDDPRARPWLYPPLLSATPAGFQAQMEAIRRLYRPISVVELLAALDNERPLPARSVLITFDDAYEDFAQHAWPVVHRLDIPVTLFVPTGYPGETRRSFWWDRLWSTIVANSGIEAAAAELRLPLDHRQQDVQVVTAMIEHYKSIPHDEAMDAIESFCNKLGGDPPASGVLDWSQLQQLAAEGLFLAPHSRSHPLLTNVSGPQLREELAGSRLDLAQRLAMHPESVVSDAFAYPAGAYNKDVVGHLADLDFRLAFTTQRGVNRLGDTDPLRFRRINVGRRATPNLIRAQILVSALHRRLAAGRPTVMGGP